MQSLASILTQIGITHANVRNTFKVRQVPVVVMDRSIYTEIKLNYLWDAKRMRETVASPFSY